MIKSGSQAELSFWEIDLPAAFEMCRLIGHSSITYILNTILIGNFVIILNDLFFSKNL